MFGCGVKSVRIGFLHVLHSSIYRVNALVFNSKANLERRGFRPKFSMKWRVILEPDPDTNEWAIWCPELPGCTSAGITQEEALNNIREAIELYLQPDAIDLLPGAVIREVMVG